MERVVERFHDKVHFVLYSFALRESSNIATQVALCAGEQGKFWEMHKLIYQRQASWHTLQNPLSTLVQYAGEVPLDTAMLQQCVQSGRMEDLIQADKTLGRGLQVRSTPTVFINEQRIIGAQPEYEYARVIRRELARARQAAQ
jgi:protein-disulfide isomerase